MFTRSIEAIALAMLFALTGCQSTSPVAISEDVAGPVVNVDRKSAALFDDALAAIAANRLRDAEVLLTELTAREPNLSGPWVNLGMVQNELNDTVAAEASLKKAINANPANCVAYTELGLMARRAGDFLAAEANYLACLKHVPDFREAHLNLGILYELYLGRLPDALGSYQAYLTLVDGGDRRVAGWVTDLERRLALVAGS
jgi:tetratricopeptide (TPR) repeat protein